MDILAHALWVGVGTTLASRRVPLSRRTVTAAIVLAVLPDLVHLLPIGTWVLFGEGTWQTLVAYVLAPPDKVPAVPATVLQWTDHFHCIMHSAVVAGVATLLLWPWRRSLWIPLLGWWSHIVIDVFSHSADFYPAPVLYPFTMRGFDGIAWNSPWFFAVNYGLLAAAFIYLVRTRQVSRWSEHSEPPTFGGAQRIGVQMFSSSVDNLLARFAARQRKDMAGGVLPTRLIDTPVGPVRVHDSGTEKPCVVLVPDGPNVIEHHEGLIALLSQNLRVVCFDMPGFGHSLPQSSYGHSLDQGAQAVLGVLDHLGIENAALAFSCANGLYALRAARMAPERISTLVLSQTPSLTAMHAWTDRVIPWPLRIPVVGQIATWLFRHKLAHGWYRVALPRTTEPRPFQKLAVDALCGGACFCLAGVVQGLIREEASSLNGVATPCTMIWGDKDHSHRHTDPKSLLGCVPQAEIVHFQDCGHFPDIEQPERFAAILVERVARYATPNG